jgi:hypothetical protein
MTSLIETLNSVLDANSTYLIYIGIALLCVVVAYVIMNYPLGFGFMEGFNGELQSGTKMEDAHGSAPAGVHAVSGDVQYKENVDAEHVNAANKQGNPQDTDDELKRQPAFDY